MHAVTGCVAASAAGGPGACGAADRSSLWAPPTSVYGNSLWLAQDDASEETPTPSPLRIPLKSMDLAASPATVPVVDEGPSPSSSRPSALAAADLAHLIAPSHSTRLATQPPSSCPTSTKQPTHAGKEASKATAASSPRIAAVHRSSSTAADAAEGFDDLGLGSLLGRLWWRATDAGLPAEGLPADAAAQVVAAATDDAVQAAPPAPSALDQLDIGFEVEAGRWSTHTGSSNSSPGAASGVCRASPAHLIAPALPPLPEQPSPVAAPCKTGAGSGSISRAISERSQQHERPSGHGVLPEQGPVLAPYGGHEDLADRQSPPGDHQQQQQRLQQQLVQQQQWEQQPEPAAEQAAPQLGEQGQMHGGRDAPQRATPPAAQLDCSGMDACRSRMAGIRATSPHAKAWSVDSSHIQLVFCTSAALCSTPAASSSCRSGLHNHDSAADVGEGVGAPGKPLHAFAAVSEDLALTDLAEQQLPEHTVGDSAAGQYDQLLQQLVRLDLSKPRRAVLASLSSQGSAAPARTLLQRLGLSCFAGQAGNRRKRERERVHLLCLSRLPYSPDDPLHLQLFRCVCRGFTGCEPEAAGAAGGRSPWEVLGFSAANPAGDLGDTGLLCLLLLLLLVDRAPTLAARLLAASRGAAAKADSQQQLPSPGFRLAEVAVEATGWVQQALSGGRLAENGCYQRAEDFWLAAMTAFLKCWEEAFMAASGPQGGLGLQLDPARMLLTILHSAQQRVGGIEE